MAVITLAADSTTLTLNGKTYNGLGAGDFMTIDSPNQSTSRTNSRNGGVNIQERVDKGVKTVKIIAEYLDDLDTDLTVANNKSGVTLFDGSAKTNFNKNGIDGVETHSLESGSITDQPSHVFNDQDGNAVREWTLEFRNGIRNL